MPIWLTHSPKRYICEIKNDPPRKSGGSEAQVTEQEKKISRR